MRWTRLTRRNDWLIVHFSGKKTPESSITFFGLDKQTPDADLIDAQHYI